MDPDPALDPTKIRLFFTIKKIFFLNFLFRNHYTAKIWKMYLDERWDQTAAVLIAHEVAGADDSNRQIQRFHAVFCDQSVK